MIVKNTVLNETLYICLDGELDEQCAQQVREKLDNLIVNNVFSKVVFDMSKLIFMDSTGIGVLLGRYKKLSSINIPCYIACPNNTINRLLSLSGVYTIMPKIEF